MHIKRRGTRAMLYRSSWMPKGANGNTHGYSTQTFVGSLSLEAEALPADLANKFSEAEVCCLENKLFQPARLAAQQKERAAASREADPMWRLDEAIRLTLDAAERSERNVVPNVKVAAVQSALGKVRTVSPSPLQGQNAGQPSAPVTSPVAEQGRTDPLKDALTAIKAARDAVAAGKYGVAPAEGVRATYPYRRWAEIFEAIEGAGNDSLLRALQTKGFAKTRGK
jgi:hypothetical protein